nr:MULTISPECIES: BCCT family transporter [unclassified Shewanella]
MTIQATDTSLSISPPSSKNDLFLISVSLLFVFSLIVLLMLYPESSQEAAVGMFASLTNSIGSFVQLLGFACVCIVLFIAASKYGTIKLGEGDPEYSNMSWIFMFICAGLGSATMYWAFMEWAYYYNSIGLNITAESNQALRHSLSYVFFHWGITPWAIYALASITMAYHFHVNRSKGLNLSSLVSSITGLKDGGMASRITGRVLDLIFLFSTFGGLILTTTITIGTVSTGLSSLFGFENVFLSKYYCLVW